MRPLGALALAPLALLLAAPAAGATTPDIHRSFDCRVDGREIRLEELTLKPGSGLELRAVRNPEARPNPSCQGGYGGPDLEKLVSDPEWIPGFEVLGAVNGTVFREQSGRYVSNQLVWSKGAGVIAPLRRRSGSHVFVADAKGGHDLTTGYVHTPDFVTRLQKRFPTMTLAIQSNMALMSELPRPKGQSKKRGQHWSACPDPASGDWRCLARERTLLCARSDGSISLVTTSPALPMDLARGLRPGGACRTGCALLYNLDGGGSTQMARAGKQGRFALSGRRVETSQPGCSPYRPVDNYLVIGRSR